MYVRVRVKMCFNAFISSTFIVLFYLCYAELERMVNQRNRQLSLQLGRMHMLVRVLDVCARACENVYKCIYFTLLPPMQNSSAWSIRGTAGTDSSACNKAECMYVYACLMYVRVRVKTCINIYIFLVTCIFLFYLLCKTRVHGQ